MNNTEHQRWLKAWNEGMTFAKVLDAVELQLRNRIVAQLRKRALFWERSAAKADFASTQRDCLVRMGALEAMADAIEGGA